MKYCTQTCVLIKTLKPVWARKILFVFLKMHQGLGLEKSCHFYAIIILREVMSSQTDLSQLILTCLNDKIYSNTAFANYRRHAEGFT